MRALLRPTMLALLLAGLAAGTAAAEDAFYDIRLGDLQITEGKLPQEESESDDTMPWRAWTVGLAMEPYAVLDGPGEAYALWRMRFTWGGNQLPDNTAFHNVLVIRGPKGAAVTGRLFIAKFGYSGMTMVRFKVPASAASDQARRDFYRVKELHYEQIPERDVPGGAWFRYQIRQAEIALDEKPDQTERNRRQFNINMQRESTYDLFSGGRAVSENLQLDRDLLVQKDSDETVDISKIEGITTPAIDWTARIKDAKPKLDPLAAAVPADQHVVFFPSFAKLLEVADNADEQGTRVLRLLEPRSEDGRTLERYERQLGLSNSKLSRILGPGMVRSVAITGSDPYFMTGTDVAVLFDSSAPAALYDALGTMRMDRSFNQDDDVDAALDAHMDVAGCIGFVSPDRRISNYSARLGSTVVVTNSLAQLKRLVEVHNGKLPAIATLPEYKFFRSRYVLGDADESAFLFLSDATIRRWCGPRWRIANSRRMRGAAVLAELQAEFFRQLAGGHVEAGPIHTDLASVQLGDLRLTPAGVVSSTLGTLDFQTPILELPLERVTKAEADAYKQWRDGYERNWRWGFDPIALRIAAGPKRLGADLTVMPLIAGSDYREMLSLVQGAQLKPGSGDPHEALAQYVMALNIKSPLVHSASNFMQGIVAGASDPMGWLGEWFTVFADDDPFWDDLAKQKTRAEKEKFVEENLGRLPVAVECDVASPLKLTVFIVGLRGMIEQTAPGMVTWESLTYHDQPYVKISPTERGKQNISDLRAAKDLALYYAIAPDRLIVTLNDSLLKRALDRRAAGQKSDKAAAGAGTAPVAAAQTPRPWLGSSIGLRASERAMRLPQLLGSMDMASEMQMRSWSNLPILNEWHRLYPNQDPVALHEKFWQVRLVCPGGGKYVWNDRWQTMESTVYGSPAEPKTGPTSPSVLDGLHGLDFGINFEDQGLRARMEIEREPAAK